MAAAVGPSIAADVRQLERVEEKEPESKLDVLVRAHGVTRDVAERYLMACDDKLGDTHKMLQASRVRFGPGSIAAELLPSAYVFHMPHLQPAQERTAATDLASEGGLLGPDGRPH